MATLFCRGCLKDIEVKDYTRVRTVHDMVVLHCDCGKMSVYTAKELQKLTCCCECGEEVDDVDDCIFISYDLCPGCYDAWKRKCEEAGERY